MQRDLISTSHLEWDSQIALEYRSQGRICQGIGTLPQTPQQSFILGAPFIVNQCDEKKCSLQQKDIISSSQHATYHGLRSQGFVVTDGLKFGVDWLIYREDPLTIHSEALIMTTLATSSVTPMDLVALNRVAVGVKKKAILSVYIPPPSKMSTFSSNTTPSQSEYGLQSATAIETSKSLTSGIHLAFLNIERVKDI